jgi:hypothetical protein
MQSYSSGKTTVMKIAILKKRESDFITVLRVNNLPAQKQNNYRNFKQTNAR